MEIAVARLHTRVMGADLAGDVLDQWLSGEGLAVLDHITGGALDVVGVIDRDLVVRYVNWTGPGLTREGVIGKSVLNLVPPGYEDISRGIYEQVLRTGRLGSSRRKPNLAPMNVTDLARECVERAMFFPDPPNDRTTKAQRP